MLEGKATLAASRLYCQLVGTSSFAAKDLAAAGDLHALTHGFIRL